MKNSRFFLFLTCCLLCLFSCDKESRIEQSGKDGVIYELTLEEDDPLANFEGYAGGIVESPVGTSKYALLVDGGCIAPHFYRSLGPFDEDLTLTLCVEGLTLDFGGSVVLHNTSTFESISLQVEDQEWTSYETEQTLFLDQGDTIRLSFASGGIAQSRTYFDNLVITALEE